MAYTSWQSGAIPEGTQYYTSKQPLGDYMLYLQFDATSGTPTVVARCDYPSGIRSAAQKSLPTGTQIQQWSIEANETEATVYAVIQIPEGGGKTSPLETILTQPIVTHSGNMSFTGPDGLTGEIVADEGAQYIFIKQIEGRLTVFVVSQNQNAVIRCISHWEYEGREITDTQLYGVGIAYTYNEKTVYYNGNVANSPVSLYRTPNISADYNLGSNSYMGTGKDAWTAIYGDSSGSDYTEETIIVGRFAIDLGDAGGYPGGGGGWISPGDWNPVPTTTLHLFVNGALSGRHNDPLNDTSFSYVPADKATTKDYGGGGDGGNGGGGGAGASTIIVRQFATNKANSKDILALAKRHGYGSGGGKGGKGGDGCILIYY